MFVHDYHPGAETLMSKHFTQVQRINGLVSGVFHADLASRAYSQNKAGKCYSLWCAFVAKIGMLMISVVLSVIGVCEPRQHAGLLPESLIWAYVVQLCSAMRTIHAAGLACRMLDPSKILITGKSRSVLTLMAGYILENYYCLDWRKFNDRGYARVVV